MPTKKELRLCLILVLVAGVISYASSVGAASATYTYDELDRLKRVDYNDGASIGYDYDKIGNRLSSYATPTANFTASTQSGVLPLNVSFVDMSAGNAIQSWQWDFGDGTASNEKNPIHTYNSVGAYTVTLTVTNPLGSSTAAKTSYVTVQLCGGTTHARIAGKGSYATLLDAYNAAATGDTIQAQAQLFTENLTASQSKSVSLVGGYSCDYITNTGTSMLQGALNTTTSSGVLSIGNFFLQK